MAGKRYAAARASVNRERVYAPLEAVRTIKNLQTSKFDETVEVHLRLGVNVRHADQQLREIAETKLPDLNANDVESAMAVVAGTARSMGVEVEA